MAKLKKFIKHPNVLVISGVRRSGKSILALLLFKNKKFAYINFDDERLVGFERKDFNNLLQVFYELYGTDLEHFIFNEIHNIKYWELFITRLRRTKKIIITGSNARLLAGELATHLTGRYIDFILYPFSFKEFLIYKKIPLEANNVYTTKEVAQIKNSLEEYILIKDVHTIKNYIDYLSSAFLVFILNKFSYKLKQHVIAHKKIYGLDTGTINSIAFQFSKNIGKLTENVVLLEFLRKKSYFKNDLEIYFWKDYSHREVDFIIKKQGKITQLIQVCADITGYKTKERETKSLLEASKKLQCNNLLIITQDIDTEEKIKTKTIKFIPLWKWLLSSS